MLNYALRTLDADILINMGFFLHDLHRQIHNLYEQQLTSDDDQQLRLLTNRIRQEVRSHTGWQRLGNLLLITGQFTKAEELYNVLLNQASTNDEKLLYYNQLRIVHKNQGDYKKAICCYKEVLEIQQKSLPSNHPSLATSYNNIGMVYYNMKDYSKALSYLEDAHDIFQCALPPTHSSIKDVEKGIEIVKEETMKNIQ
ncbi:unnamed protein product [Adineta steineri]|nr:unnamed protein product [Adineta steineri]